MRKLWINNSTHGVWISKRTVIISLCIKFSYHVAEIMNLNLKKVHADNLRTLSNENLDYCCEKRIRFVLHWCFCKSLDVDTHPRACSARKKLTMLCWIFISNPFLQKGNSRSNRHRRLPYRYFCCWCTQWRLKRESKSSLAPVFCCRFSCEQ